MKPTTSAPLRAARLFVILVLAASTVVSGSFLLFNVVIPDWFPVVGRWIPGILSLVVIVSVRLPGGVTDWWGIRPGGWKRLVVGSLAGMFILFAVYVAVTFLRTFMSDVELIALPVIGQIALLMVPLAVVFALSTMGEEVAWRGFLQRALEGAGRRRAAVTVSAIWVLFHVPLHGAMAIQGLLPWDMAICATVLLFPLGVFLSALTTRYGSVWPAVLAHAVPFSIFNFVANIDTLGSGSVITLTLWACFGLLAASELLGPKKVAAQRA